MYRNRSIVDTDRLDEVKRIHAQTPNLALIASFLQQQSTKRHFEVHQTVRLYISDRCDTIVGIDPSIPMQTDDKKLCFDGYDQDE